MTTTATNDETPKKKLPRKGSKAAARIAELETQYAIATASGDTAKATRLRTNISRLEDGDDELPEGEEQAVATEGEVDLVQCELNKGYEIGPDGVRELTEEETAELHAAQPCALDTTGIATEDQVPAVGVTWNDVVAASNEVEANRVETEIVEDVLDVKLSEADLADIARANAADDDEKTDRQRKVDALKVSLKNEKSAIEALDARMHDRNNAVRKGSQSRKAKWILESIFATNTARYRDPITNRVVHERPLRGDERQVALPLVSDDATAKAAQLSLGDVEPTDMTDPEALLRAAQEGEADPADSSLDNDGSTDDLGGEDDSDDADDSEEEGDDQ